MKSEKSQKPSKHHKKKGSKEKKKSKKKNAKKHHRHQEERKLSADNSTYFSSLLSSGILSFPSLFEDFPAMISTMDSGQSVNISKISDKKKASILNKLFSYLPLINDPNYGWCYNNPNGEKISSIILKKLLEEKAIKQPKELNQGEVLASQKAPLALLELFTNFPELLSEMPILLSNLLDGKAVDVEDIENEDVRDGLEKLFKSLDLAIDSGYVLPYDSRRSAAFEALGSLKDMIVSHERFSSDMEVEDGLGNASGSDDSSKSNDNDDDDDDDGEGSGDCNPRGREESEDFQLPQRKFDMVVTEQQVVYKGPAMPTREQLALAQSHLLHNPQSFIEEEEEEDEEEEGVGPRLYNPAKDASLVLRQSLQKALPLGFTGVELESAIETITSAATMQSSKSFPAESNEEPKEINEREEWILTPGNSKLISGLQCIDKYFSIVPTRVY